MPMSLSDIETLTRQYGEGWGYPHARRVLALVGRISAGLAYDQESLAYAVYLHDWGAFPQFRQPGVDHALRSRQVAEELLPQTGLSRPATRTVLEAIERHDYRDPRPVATPEARLLREADCLDLLGVIGVAREFAWGPNNLAVCRDRIRNRMEGIRGHLTLPAAQALAGDRLAEMERLLDRLEEESFGFL